MADEGEGGSWSGLCWEGEKSNDGSSDQSSDGTVVPIGGGIGDIVIDAKLVLPQIHRCAASNGDLGLCRLEKALCEMVERMVRCEKINQTLSRRFLPSISQLSSTPLTPVTDQVRTIHIRLAVCTMIAMFILFTLIVAIYPAFVVVSSCKVCSRGSRCD